MPVTRSLTEAEIAGEYEANTGEVIAETIEGLHADPLDMPAVLVHSHGPFVWGADVQEAVENAVALETVAGTAAQTLLLAPGSDGIAEELLLRHFLRKHGAASYYGQRPDR